MENLRTEAESWREDYEVFIEATRKFYNKEIDAKAYKGISGGFGSYAQKGGTANMLRLRMPGGAVNKKRLKFVVDSIDKYHIDRVHFTTCQTIQLHNLGEKTVCALAVEALDAGIVTRGGGGDFPRNVMVSPLSGVEKGEYFDVMPYAQAASDFLMGFIRGPKMPRKLKVCFSNTPKNMTHATFRDLGFVAKENGTFDVYSAGGLGNNPSFGVKVAEDVAPDQVLYYIQAMYETFLAYGNYENRAKARTRYMKEALGGEEKYKEAYLEKLEEVKGRDRDLTLHLKESETAEKQGDDVQVSDRRVIAQKQPGLYSVHCHPYGGSPKPELFKTLYETIKDMDQVELRLAPDESFYVINCTGSEAKKVLEATKDCAATCFEESVACIGASICQQGVRDSQALLCRLIEMEKKEGFADGVLPQIHISGCPSSCGTHQIGAIGFRGGVKVIDKVAHPAFVLFINGCDIQGKERMGEEAGTMLEETIPAFLKKLGETVREAGTDFETWRQANPDGVKEIAGEFLV